MVGKGIACALFFLGCTPVTSVLQSPDRTGVATVASGIQYAVEQSKKAHSLFLAATVKVDKLTAQGKVASAGAQETISKDMVAAALVQDAAKKALADSNLDLSVKISKASGETSKAFSTSVQALAIAKKDFDSSNDEMNSAVTKANLEVEKALKVIKNAPGVATRLLTAPVKDTEGPHVNLSMMDVQSAKTLHMDAGVGGNAAPGVATRLLTDPVKDTEGPHVNLSMMDVQSAKTLHMDAGVGGNAAPGVATRLLIEPTLMIGKSFLSAKYEVMPIKTTSNLIAGLGCVGIAGVALGMLVVSRRGVRYSQDQEFLVQSDVGVE